MQEVLKDGSEGKVHVENTVLELVPHIVKSLKNPNVKYVKVFRGIMPENEKRVVAEEERRSPLDKLIEKCEEEDKKELKKAQLKIPRKK